MDKVRGKNCNCVIFGGEKLFGCRRQQIIKINFDNERRTILLYLISQDANCSTKKVVTTYYDKNHDVTSGVLLFARVLCSLFCQ